MQTRRLPMLLLGLAAAWATVTCAQVTVVPSEPLVLREGAGAASLVVRNQGPVSVLLNLSAGAFVDQTSRTKLNGPKVTFAPEAGAQPLPAFLSAGQALPVQASVSGLTATAAVAKIYNGAVEAGTLNAVAVDTALNLTLDGPGAPDNPLPFLFGRTAALTLKNGSKDFLTLDWRLMVGGTEIENKTTVLTPNGHARLMFTPHPEVYSWKDFIRPTQHGALLLIKLHAPNGVASNLLPKASIPVELTMMRFSQETTDTIFAIWVMFFLLVGGAISLLGTSVLPNILKKIGMRRKISELAERTSSVSARVDSYLRVLIRLERAKIIDALKEIGPLSLSSAERFEEVTDSIERLEKRLEIVERLDTLLRNFDEVSCWAPPSICAAIDGILRTASKQLHSFALSDELVAAAGRTLDKAEGLLAELGNNDAQAVRIVENFKVLLVRAKTFKEPSYLDFKQALPGIFQILEMPAEEMATIVQPMFFAIDHAIAATHLALDYAMVRASVAVDTEEIAGLAGKEIRVRQAARECELIEALGTLSWKALRAATLLVHQMRENIYDVDVLAEMGKRRPDGERRVRIVFDTQRARPYMPVNFSVAFDDPRFKDAAALGALSFRWTFPDDLTEEGAKVCHYFTGNEAKLHHSGKIKIVLAVQSQRNLTAATTLEGTIEVKGRRERQSTRAFAEAVRFLMAFGVALAALEAGALDRLAKLDFLAATIAVIALGFGADSIKNLLTQSSKKPTP